MRGGGGVGGVVGAGEMGAMLGLECEDMDV